MSILGNSQVCETFFFDLPPPTHSILYSMSFNKASLMIKSTLKISLSTCLDIYISFIFFQLKSSSSTVNIQLTGYSESAIEFQLIRRVSMMVTNGKSIIMNHYLIFVIPFIFIFSNDWQWYLSYWWDAFGLKHKAWISTTVEIIHGEIHPIKGYQLADRYLILIMTSLVGNTQISY